MKIKTLLIHIGFFIILLCISPVPSTVAQTEFHPVRTIGPDFHVDLVNVDSPEPGMSRLNLYIKTTFDELQFVLEEGIYTASYEVSAVIYDENEYQIDGKIDQEETEASSYEETNSKRSYSLAYLNFDLEPDKYKLAISITDLETKVKRTIESEFELEDFADEKFALSDIAMVRNVEIDSIGIKSFHPDVADFIFDLSNTLFAYFEIYSRQDKSETFEISFVIKDSEKDEIFESNYKRRKDGPRTMEVFQIPTNKLSQGIYSIELKVKEGRSNAEMKKNFAVRWINMPSSISDIDLAIKQMKYIARKKDYEKIKNADQGERLEAFQRYWKKFDPTPGTIANEAMDEYYSRVEMANQRFTGFRDGWKTDMGMIYIIFGPPNDVERHPFDSGYKPYEIWYYHTINREFTFMDEAGFGEYRLITTGWESWRELLK